MKVDAIKIVQMIIRPVKYKFKCENIHFSLNISGPN